MELDCRGLSCPEPVVNTKKAIKDNPSEIDVLVDHVAGKENVSRFLRAMKYDVTITDTEDGWRISGKK
ncbi:MAG: sulfurtransferase TusA family protein [Sphaerochaetaceae bacterium]|nr:sulfurtransferase TusA family protein [Sphaerochaetaceae bacterium]